MGEFVRLSIRHRRGTRTWKTKRHFSFVFAVVLIILNRWDFFCNFPSGNSFFISLTVVLCSFDRVHGLSARGLAVVLILDRSYTLTR